MSRLVIVAGPNGSGKSTLTEPTRLARLEVSFPTNYINADDIARALRQELPDLDQEQREHLAFRRARSLRQAFRELGESFAFETVFSHPSTLLDMQRARTAGYEVVLIFVTTANPDINVARVAGRYRAGGHDVPVDRIRRRYERGMRLLPCIVEEADTALVFDSTRERETRLCFYQSYFGTKANLPEYLQTRLAEPLGERQRQRERLVGVPGPDIAQGTYSGPFIEVLSHYAVQELDGGRQVRHDRLLLTSDPTEGDTVTVHYHDGEGRIALP